MSSLKSSSSKKGGNLSKFSQKNIKIQDGYKEDRAREIIEGYTKKIEKIKEFSPQILVYMLETFFIINQIESFNIPKKALSGVQKEIRPTIKHIINIYNYELEREIQDHLNTIFFQTNEDIDFILENKVYDNSLIEYVIDKFNLDVNSPKFNEKLIDGIDYYQAYGLENWKIYQDFRDMMDEFYPFLKMNKWFEVWDLMKAIMKYYNENNNKLLKEWTLKHNVDWDITSEFVIYKKFEEYIRNLEHHNGTIISNIFENAEIPDLTKVFFSLLDHFEEPTKEI